MSLKLPVLQLTERGIRTSLQPSVLKKLQAHYQQYHYLKLPGFLDKSLCRKIIDGSEKARFYKKNHRDIAVDLCMRENETLRTLQFLTNDPVLFSWIQTLTGCPPLGCFTGRVYRMLPGSSHDDWHNDMTETRQAALSLNLSPQAYQGGSLWIKEISGEKRQWEIPNLVPGDAVIFRLSYQLMHKVSEVSGKIPKTAYAGWFRTKPHFLSQIKKLRKKKS